MSHDEPAILVVDDDVDTCRNLSDILTDLGYRVDIGPRRPVGPGAGPRRAATTSPCST